MAGELRDQDGWLLEMLFFLCFTSLDARLLIFMNTLSFFLMPFICIDDLFMFVMFMCHIDRAATATATYVYIMSDCDL